MFDKAQNKAFIHNDRKKGSATRIYLDPCAGLAEYANF